MTIASAIFDLYLFLLEICHQNNKYADYLPDVPYCTNEKERKYICMLEADSLRIYLETFLDTASLGCEAFSFNRTVAQLLPTNKTVYCGPLAIRGTLGIQEVRGWPGHHS